MTRALSDGTRMRLLELRQLLFAADERRVEAPCERIDSLAHREQAVRGDWSDLAFRRDRLHRFGLDRVAHEPVGRLADQHLARPRRLLEPRGDVDRVARDERLAA